jgi:hypothetical protein
MMDFEQHWRAQARRCSTSWPRNIRRHISAAIRWETAEEDLSDAAMTPDEIMDKLEQRVGPKGRKLFEQFLRKVNKLQAQQYLEAQAQRGETERSRERGPG